jgi:thioredoxin 1
MVLSVTERTFEQEVLESSTPVLVNFSAPWCGLCKAINPLLSQFQAKWGNQVKLVGINADNNFKLANTYKLTSLPTLILFVDGQIMYRLEYFHSRDEIALALDGIALSVAKGKVRSRQYQIQSV